MDQHREAPEAGRPRRSRLRGVAVLLTTLLLVLLSAELGLRIAAGEPLAWRRLNAEFKSLQAEEHQPRALYHERLGWVPHPGRRVIRGATYTVGEHGLRLNGSADTLEPGAGGPILALGDSFTFGDDVGDADTWPAQLERMLGRPVANAGVFAYGLDQIVLRAEELVPKLQPALVVVSYIPDDIRRCGLSVFSRAKPYFVLEEGELRLENVPVPRAQGAREAPPSKLRTAAGYSFLADFVMRRVAPDSWLEAREAAVPGQGVVSAPEKRGVAVACALLERLADLGREHDVPIVVVQQYEKYLKNVGVRRSRAAASCVKDVLPVLDLELLLDRYRRGLPDKFAALFDQHMTPEGNRVVAERIVKFLSERELLAR